ACHHRRGEIKTVPGEMTLDQRDSSQPSQVIGRACETPFEPGQRFVAMSVRRAGQREKSSGVDVSGILLQSLLQFLLSGGILSAVECGDALLSQIVGGLSKQGLSCYQGQQA